MSKKDAFEMYRVVVRSRWPFPVSPRAVERTKKVVTQNERPASAIETAFEYTCLGDGAQCLPDTRTAGVGEDAATSEGVQGRGKEESKAGGGKGVPLLTRTME